ncbi:DUF5689 domain-containing protein [Flavobacterium sp.]|uniref:DUF5689 domain-containing protein n=1 Tax=Flavobacterium sp. TaxID=239 RepID=UPI00286D4940|nr:DUF5689 domain-containing protein [Flavobacterium sp.]
MKNKIKNIFAILFTSAVFFGCVNDSFETPTNPECVVPNLVKTKEVADIYNLANITGNTSVKYTADDIIEAIVTSSDEGGNFFKTMSFMSVDGTRGFSMSIDDYSLYTKKLQPGKKVFIKLKDLYYSLPTGFARGLVLGAKPTSVQNVDRIPALDYGKSIIPTCTVVDEETIVKKITLTQASNDALLNSLVEIDNVQFQSDCGTYSKKDFDTSLKLVSGSNTLDLRTSRFANFAGEFTPSGNGKIRGILTKYGNGYQLVLRNSRDVKFINPRVGVIPPVALGGSSLQYLGLFTENFETFAVTSTGFTTPKYINLNVVGNRYWDVKSFSNNEYLQMSAFNAGCTKAHFIIPVDMTAANGISFKSKDGYFDGQPLKIYYSTDLIPNGNINQATLVNITDKFTLANGLPTTATSYATSFTNSGTYAIPASVTGNGYFIFEYDGTNGATTTIQLDDIVIN